MNNNDNSPWQTGRGGLEKLTVATANGANAEIYRHGAHVTSWRTAGGREWIFTSEQAQFAEGKAIRGGVPIIFPQFNAFGSGPRHGFARNLPWQLCDAPASADKQNRCVLTLANSDATAAAWDHQFETQFIAEVSDTALRMTLSVRNTDDKPFRFTAALHTYFAVADLAHTRLQGLGGLSYWDNDGSDFSKRQKAEDDELTFTGAIDRVYFDCQQPLMLIDGDESLRIESEGFSEVVVWNPGPEAVRDLADMADHEYKKMLCVEAALIDQPVELAPGQVWQGRQILQA